VPLLEIIAAIGLFVIALVIVGFLFRYSNNILIKKINALKERQFELEKMDKMLSDRIKRLENRFEPKKGVAAQPAKEEKQKPAIELHAKAK